MRVYTHLLAFPSIRSCCNKGTQKNRGHRFPRTFSTATPFPTNCILSGAFSYWKRDFLTGNIRNSYCDEPVAAHILLHWGKYTEKLLQAHQCRPFSCKYINSTSFVGIIRGEKVGGKWALTFSRCWVQLRREYCDWKTFGHSLVGNFLAVGNWHGKFEPLSSFSGECWGVKQTYTIQLLNYDVFSLRRWLQKKTIYYWIEISENVSEIIVVRSDPHYQIYLNWYLWAHRFEERSSQILQPLKKIFLSKNAFKFEGSGIYNRIFK